MKEADLNHLKLSVCLIVKNEEAHLRRCVESVATLADEIIVVDTGSTDGTVALAKELGARVITIAWANDFSAARNHSLAAARGAWILVLDADEFLEERARVAIEGLLRENTSADGRGRRAFSLRQKSSSDGGRTGMMVSIVRLFPNCPAVRYEWPIHEQVVTSLTRAGIPVVETAIEVIHTGYADPVRNVEKQRRNLAILEAQVAQGGEVYPLTWFLLGGAHLDLGDPERALRAYEECRRLAGDQSDLGRGAQVRMTTCLLKLKRASEAIEGMPTDQGEGWHPELLVLRGEAEAMLGRGEEARRWHERVLTCADGVFVPPCNLVSVKVGAVAFLGGHWKNSGRPALAVALLRMARDCQVAGRDFTPEMLAGIYQQHGVS